MKSEFDQEMDTLLRAHARREGAARARTVQSNVPASAQADAHLDADELSAYAEQALPASTRARYVVHLAACDLCRTQVVMLTRAAGIAEQLEQQTVVPITGTSASSWRERLAAFFAPGAWRYALPLIALFVVSGGALWLVNGTRTRRANESAASQQVASAPRSNEASEQHHAQADEKAAADNATGGSMNGTVATTTTAPVATAANTNAAIDDSAATRSPAAAAPPAGELLARNEPQDKLTAAPPASPTPPVQPAVIADAPTPLSQSTAANQRSVNQNAGAGLNSQMNTQQSARNVYAPPATADADAQTEMQARRVQTLPEQEKAAIRARDNERAAQPTAKERSAKREGGEAGGARGETANTRGPNKSAPAPKPQRVADDDKDTSDVDEVARTESRRPDTATRAGRVAEEDAGATRSVAGRKFRRQKSVWIDNAYRAGQATVNVKRDSEQWRALIADEPELRRIADALGGEVVVVWHGRAYRIKP